jgi:hypothetical protein
MGVEQGFGVVDMVGFPHILRNNHMLGFQPQVLGMFHHPNPKYRQP